MANGSAHFKKGIFIQILNATDNYPVLPAQRFYPTLRETSSGVELFSHTGNRLQVILNVLSLQLPTVDLKLVAQRHAPAR